MKKKENSSFCILPWVHQMIDPSGKLRLCCISKGYLKDEKDHYLKVDEKITAYWNSDIMQKIRKKMLQGKKIPFCQECYYFEDKHQLSKRQIWNQRYLEHGEDKEDCLDRIKYSEEHSFKVNKLPFYMDLRLGNLCNLKCRMCHPINSSQLEKEWAILRAENKTFRALDYTKFEKVGNWYTDKNITDSLTKYIPYLRDLYLTGGEPSINENNLKFLKRCIQLGYSENIRLLFNTNLTVVNRELLDYSKRFKSVQFNLSLDGYGKVQEYIRFPSRWKSIESNIEKILEFPNIRIVLTPVIQLLNVLEFTKLLSWFEKKIEIKQHNNANIYCSLLTTPDFLSIGIAPISLKDRALESIEAYKKESKLYNEEKELAFRETISSIEAMLKVKKYYSKKIMQFKEFNDALDKARKTRIKEYLPELYSYLYR